MRLRKRTYRDKKTGKKHQCSNWTIVFTHNDTQIEFPGFTDRRASAELGRKLERLVALRVAGEQPDAGMVPWLEMLPLRMQKRLVKVGLLDPERAAGGQSLSEHLVDWQTTLLAKGSTEKHVRLMVSRAKKVFKGCGFRFYTDIKASKVQQYLAALRRETEDKDGISAQTFNFYVQAVKQFCRWMVLDRRASENPVAHLAGLNVRTDRRHDRRAQTVEECRKLLTTTKSGPFRYNMSGPERAMLYQLALETGLRANELRSLTCESFDLDASPPTVTVQAAYSKHRREDTLPLRQETASALRSFLASALPDTPVFHMPDSTHTARMIRADLADANIPYRDTGGRVADFHSLRHTFISNLANSGVHPKTAQALARHSTITLTMDRYTHSLVEQRADAVARLPDLSGGAETEAVKATGTDGESVKSDCPPDCPGQGVSQRYSVGRSGLRDKGEGEGNLSTEPSIDSSDSAHPAEQKMAEGEGFEPPVPCGTAVFKTAAFVHSAIPPDTEGEGLRRLLETRHLRPAFQSRQAESHSPESPVQSVSNPNPSSGAVSSACSPASASSNTLSSTKMGAPVWTAIAMASLGRESTSTISPSLTICSFA